MNRFIFLLALIVSSSSTLKAESNEAGQPDTQSKNPINSAHQLQSSKGSSAILIPRLITHPVLKDLTLKNKQLPTGTSGNKPIGKVLPEKKGVRRYSPKEVGDFPAPEHPINQPQSGRTKIKGKLINKTDSQP